MLIDQIIKFELRGPGFPSLTLTPITSYDHDKTKISYEKYLSELLLTAKILLKYFSLPGPNHLQNLKPNCKIF